MNKIKKITLYQWARILALLISASVLYFTAENKILAGIALGFGVYELLLAIGMPMPITNVCCNNKCCEMRGCDNTGKCCKNEGNDLLKS